MPLYAGWFRSTKLYTSPSLCSSFVEAMPPNLPNLGQDSGWSPAKSKFYVCTHVLAVCQFRMEIHDSELVFQDSDCAQGHRAAAPASIAHTVYFIYVHRATEQTIVIFHFQLIIIRSPRAGLSVYPCPAPYFLLTPLFLMSSRAILLLHLQDRHAHRQGRSPCPPPRVVENTLYTSPSLCSLALFFFR